MLWLKVCLSRRSRACFMMMSTIGLLGNGMSSIRSGVAFDSGFLRLESSFSRLLGTAVQPLSSIVFDMITVELCFRDGQLYNDEADEEAVDGQ